MKNFKYLFGISLFLFLGCNKEVDNKLSIENKKIVSNPTVNKDSQSNNKSTVLGSFNLSASNTERQSIMEPILNDMSNGTAIMITPDMSTNTAVITSMQTPSDYNNPDITYINRCNDDTWQACDELSLIWLDSGCAVEANYTDGIYTYYAHCDD